MPTFYIDVSLRRGPTRIQVEVVPPGGWDRPGCPQFVIEYFIGPGFFTRTLQLEGGSWYDRNTRLSEDEFYLRYDELGPDEAWDPGYESPLSEMELAAIGRAISDQMVVILTAYIDLFVPVYRLPTLN